MRSARSTRTGRPVLLAALFALVLAAGPAGAQQAPDAAPFRAQRLATLAAPAYFAARPAAPRLPALRSASPSKLGTALLLVGAGVGLIYGGQEAQDAIGFPGAVLRYTGYAAVAGGALFACGCL